MNLDVNQLLESGAMTGPHRRTRPLTVSMWRRLLRAVRATLDKAWAELKRPTA